MIRTAEKLIDAHLREVRDDYQRVSHDLVWVVGDPGWPTELQRRGFSSRTIHDLVALGSDALNAGSGSVAPVVDRIAAVLRRNRDLGDAG